MTASSTSEQSNQSSDGAVKTRGFMRAVGGMFHRRSRDSASRDSMLETSITSSSARPSTSAVSSSDRSRSSRPQQQQSSSSSSALRAISADEAHGRQPYRKASASSVSSKYSVDTAPSDDDDDANHYHYQFLFYPGSAEDSSFKPDKVTSNVVEIDYNAIRPSLTLQMPVFFSPPKEQTSMLRRSSILTDPREYELASTTISNNASDSDYAEDIEEKGSEISDSEFSEGVIF